VPITSKGSVTTGEPFFVGVGDHPIKPDSPPSRATSDFDQLSRVERSDIPPVALAFPFSHRAPERADTQPHKIPPDVFFLRPEPKHGFSSDALWYLPDVPPQRGRLASRTLVLKSTPQLIR